MAEFAAQAIRRINKLPLITVHPRFNSLLTVMELLHEDSFVADSKVTLRELVSAHDRGVHFLGKRLASMVTSKAVLPLGLKYFSETGRIRLINRGDEQDAIDIDPMSEAMSPYFLLDCDFAAVETAVLPRVGSSHFVSTVVEDSAAILVAIDGPAYVKVVMSFQPEVMVSPNTAAIVPPGSPIFMQGARSMLIRPVLG